MHGYQLMQAMAERTNGVWRPSPGAIYPTIAQLEDEGLVTTLAEGGRKLVTLTDAGRAYLADNAEAIGDPFAGQVGATSPGHDLRSALEEVHAATRVVGRSGTEAQIAAAFAVLGEARRSLYLILAEGPAAEPLRLSRADGRGLVPSTALTGIVTRTEWVTPHLVRVVLGGPGLAGFGAGEFTDHYVKLLLPDPATGATIRRTYTVRRWDAAAGELWIDFVHHGDEGLAGPWAAAAQPGDEIAFNGPGGEYTPDPTADWHLFVGDASALPAISASLERVPYGVPRAGVHRDRGAGRGAEARHPRRSHHHLARSHWRGPRAARRRGTGRSLAARQGPRLRPR